MNRGVDHQPIFFADADREEMGRRLAEVHERFGVATLAYCLMGNHLHLVLRAADGVLPDAMHHLTSVYSRHVNDRLGRDGPLFRGRYHSIPVETDGYLLWVTRYVHRNPLDIAGVRSIRDYRWSSYRTYLGLRPTPGFLARRPVMDLLGGRVDELVAMTEEAAPLRPRTVDDLTGLVRCARSVEDLADAAGDRPEANIDRTLLVLLAERADDPSLRRLAEAALGPRPRKAARQALRRAETRCGDDPAVARTLRWIELHLSGVR
jgi:REP element-mobilizing transposase RayT